MITVTTATTTGRDRLYHQRERDLIANLERTADEAEAAACDLYQLLDHLDELAESVDFVREDIDVLHRYSGEPLPWLQQRLGEARRAVATAAQRLRTSAEDIAELAPLTPRSRRLGHIARGYAAFAAEAERVVASFRPEREPEQVDWARVEAIETGVRKLEDVQEAEFVAELQHDLASHERNRAGLLELGMDEYVATEIDGNPALQRALATMREYVGRAPARQQAP